VNAILVKFSICILQQVKKSIINYPRRDSLKRRSCEGKSLSLDHPEMEPYKGEFIGKFAKRMKNQSF